jgi:ribose 1,5-bisphosphokinase
VTAPADKPHPPARSGHAIGPGRLVLVVGPSGSGKDTLIGRARAACERNPSVVFPRRVVTRPSSSSENNATLSEDAFKHAEAQGAFALWWQAHGHAYGIPSSIDDDIRAGRTVVCNVSRGIVGAARNRYAAVTVVLVTAPEAVLLERLAGRNRASDGDIRSRIVRSAKPEVAVAADIEISNAGPVETGTRRLLDVIRG